MNVRATLEGISQLLVHLWIYICNKNKEKKAMNLRGTKLREEGWERNHAAGVGGKEGKEEVM